MRRHGESAAIIDVFTAHHGRHAGLVRGGASRKHAVILQPGALLSLTWRARLEDQLGSFSVELITSNSAALLADRLKLYSFNALASMLSRYLPEREPNPKLFESCLDLLARLQNGAYWQHRYCIFELEFLESLGYGIDLSQCAVTAQTIDLAFVSPVSGRAVSREGAIGYEDRLLPFPAFLQRHQLAEITVSEFSDSLKLTGYFFEKRVPTTPPRLPEARHRFATMVHR